MFRVSNSVFFSKFRHFPKFRQLPYHFNGTLSTKLSWLWLKLNSSFIYFLLGGYADGACKSARLPLKMLVLGAPSYYLMTKRKHVSVK